MAINVDLPLILSVVAIAISGGTFVINYRRSRKTEQLKLCFDIRARFHNAAHKIFEITDKLNSNTTDKLLIEGWKKNLHDAILSYLGDWEFFSFLVNNKEITEQKILDYFKRMFMGDVPRLFDGSPDIRDKKDDFIEIKKLLKEWDPEYYSLHFEGK